MKLRNVLVLPLIAIACMLLQSGIRAGDKDKKDQPKQEPAKEFTVDGELTNADLKDKVLTESFCKTYVYKMTKGKSYQIDLISGAFDAFLRLENPKGDMVAADDDSGGGLNSRIIYRAPDTGDFTICAMSLGGGSTGKFKLLVKELSVAEVKPIELKSDKGQATHTGSIDANDPRYNGQKIHKLFTIKLEAGKTYQIDHMSQAFDAYLYLEDPDGKLLDQDDDGGDGLNSRITFRAANAGTYRLIATSLSGTRTGAFTLSVREKE